MVYEKKCSNCDKVLDFGGRDLGHEVENGIKFDGELYCKECVKELIEFGSSDLQEQIDDMKDKMQEVSEELGLNF